MNSLKRFRALVWIVFPNTFKLKIVASMTYFPFTFACFHIVDMVPAKVTPLPTHMIFLFSLKANLTDTVTKILWQFLTCSTKFLLTKLTDCQVQIYNVDRRWVSALRAFTITLIDVHVVDQTNCVLTNRASVLWRLVAWIVVRNECGSCTLWAGDWKIIVLNSSFGKVFFNQGRWNVWRIQRRIFKATRTMVFVVPLEAVKLREFFEASGTLNLLREHFGALSRNFWFSWLYRTP